MAAVDIANSALQKLGATRIAALTDLNVNAKACNVCYDRLKKALLRKYDWNFARAQAEIAEDATAPSWGRAARYPLPSDFIALRPDLPEDNLNTKDWQIIGRYIHTDDTSPIYIHYTKDVTDTNEMDPLFQELLAFDMAIQMCEEITNSKSLKESLKEDRKIALNEAKKANAFENESPEPPADTWLTARA